ncbi:MAG: hypothetical protein MUF30_02410 [Burkholderiales bacterium]|nr:hypothetical protein [Burkholderiales bacterium]
MRRDVAELDTLIGEVLPASRLDADALPMTVAPVDLHTLAVSVAADHPQVHVSGDAVSVDGDARLLQRLLGNLPHPRACEARRRARFTFLYLRHIFATGATSTLGASPASGRCVP